jgi:fatty-acyl-CoA synthase
VSCLPLVRPERPPAADVDSYARGPVEPPLLTETLGENLRRTVERHPRAPALVVAHQGYRLRYRGLWRESGRVARGLMAEGVQPGDRVGVWSPNRYEWVLLQFATARIGAILVNINPAYKSSELEYALQQSGTQYLFAAAGFRKTDYVAMIREIRDRCPDLEQVTIFESGWHDLLRFSRRVSARDLERREEVIHHLSPINIQYTSGTTGFPKGATLSHHNILNNAYLVGEQLGYGPRDRVCIPVPFYHCFGMVLGNLACTTHGACMVIPGETFEPRQVLETVEKERCTALYGVPMMFIAELDCPQFDDYDLSSLRTGIMAGASCPVEVMKEVRSRMHMPEVTICYGMTENSPVSTQTRRDDRLEKQVATVGTVHPHTEVKVIDPESGETLPRGAAGELCTRGYNVMLGYWRDPEATLEAVDTDGWMHTGDLARMDDESYVEIVGRIKDMIIRGGENIYPREIEEFLFRHPAVADVQVIGVPSERYGEEVMAWIQPMAGQRPTDKELEDFCRGRIATFKIPRYWKLVDEFPTTVTGKVQKFRMREMAAKEIAAAD